MKKIILITFSFSQIVFLCLYPVWSDLTSYLHPLVIGIVWFCFSVLVLFVVCLAKNVELRLPIVYFQIIMGLYSIGLFVLLFFRPANQDYGEINLVPFETILFYLSGEVNTIIAVYNLAANFGLFLPFGVYYVYVRKVPRLSELLLVAVVSVCIIESSQFLTKRGSLDMDDLILNVLGVVTGYYLFPLIRKVLVVLPKGSKTSRK
ncbi:VanZ family protein [Evansella tamaricis]|uniref:VanZ family protein n=1 Tax=Evansella tamaricis TaxID=2069301 RepID=A0ABS6JKZ5_9BACI|nr:VanZ family protein [Evansella tamaricis]MBU9713874.1 VanZ family protein [Evansella tamaricis]